MDCLFCKILDGDIPAEVVYEDDQVLAFRDINPQAPFHCLIIPRKHIATLNDIADEDQALVGHMIQAAGTIAKQQGFDESGYRTVFNCNTHGGQTVYHIHLHLLGGKPMGWPPYQDTLKVAVD
ncbi:histidine triad nucleotide-binding protein [Marinobacterium sediminicola]|uniref:Histidine triad (HIT) family protein n=1 Tax=Marinobacterium sediminicola TaxID=518898 RepID=A0ABY1RZY6_9GAMM|nr:histidine triad nucleotide-binding protein [Marinobacterium sediminicola]ULG69931.1 histidine triad nucleotide-binding protein [Marinobacterium sediminicola]SMR74380.1 histidine triad (HIT) family protein [Marinobacterium sediminicola]